MPICSLRLTLGTISACAVVLVASVTLSIALTTSLDALRSLGDRHAVALLGIANDETAKLFETGTETVDQISNLAASRAWEWPSDNATTLRLFQGALISRFTTTQHIMDSTVIMFADNTRLGINSRTATTYETFEQLVSPYSTTFPDSRILANFSYEYDKETHAPLGLASLRQAVYLPRNDSIWAQASVATFGAFAPVITPPLSVNANGEILSYLSILAPLYKYGATTRSPDTVFGFSVSSLRYVLLSSFLRRVKSTPNTAAFAYDAGGHLLGTSNDASFEVLTPVSQWRGSLRTGCVNTRDYDTSVVSGGAEHVVVCRHHVSAYPHADLNAVATGHPELLHRAAGESTVRQLKLSGGRVYAAATRVDIAFRGLQVHLLLLMPEADVLGDVITGRNVAIGVTCALVVVAAAVNVAVVWALLSPLGGIATRMVRAANLEDDDADASVSVMAEVAELQEAYYAMNAELNRIRSYVPQSVLAARKVARGAMLDDEDEELGDDSTAQDASTPRRMVMQSPRPSSTNSTRSTRSQRSVFGPVAQSASSGTGAAQLQSKGVTVVAVNLVGLHAAAVGRGTEDLARELALAAEIVEAAVTQRHGVLTFHGDRFLATFNAARPCAGHAVKGATAAGAIVASTATTGGPLNLAFACGIATGPCVVGPVGSATMKTYSVVGSAVTNAALLERLTRLHAGTTALATHRTCADAQATVPVRFVDFVKLVGRDGRARPTAVAAIMSSGSKRNAGKSGSNVATPADEWMYVMHENARGAAAYNGCFEALQRGTGSDVIKAYESVEASATAENTDDEPVPEPPKRLTEIVAALRRDPATDPADLCRTDTNLLWPL